VFIKKEENMREKIGENPNHKSQTTHCKIEAQNQSQIRNMWRIYLRFKISVDRSEKP
jgi:hypothetical protein